MAHDVKDFQKEVLERSQEVPVLVDFWAEWCGPCRVLSPVLERLAAKSNGKWLLAKVNTEELPKPAAEYRVQSIPNVKLFFEGKVVAEFVGALPEYLVKQWLKENVPSRHQKELRLARELIDSKKTSAAVGLLEKILADESDNQEAKVLLATVHLLENPAKSASLIGEVDDPRYSDTAEAFSTIVRLLGLIDHPENLSESETKKTYLDAIFFLKRAEFEKALEKFIDVIRADRYYDDDGARKACVAIFKYLGEEDPITQKYRREFSSALYL
jgi:putative thioredoxin